MNPYRCPLGAIQPTRMDAEKIKREQWNENGFLVVNIDDPRLNWVERQFVENIGTKLNGKRKKKGTA